MFFKGGWTPGIAWRDFAVAGPLLLSVLLFASLAAWLRSGHCEVELIGGLLRSTERWGFLSWRSSRPLAEIRQLIVGGEELYTEDRRPAHPSLFPAILAECHRRRPMLVAPLYPRTWLLPLSVELARRATAMKRQLYNNGDFERPITAFELTERS